MFWQEEPAPVPTQQATHADLAFAIQCRQLPFDHAYALSQAIQQALPWFAQTQGAGLHLIHLTEGNGWQQANAQDSVLYLSRRTRLSLRLPITHLAAAQALTGQQLTVDGHALTVGQAQIKPLQAFPVLLARYVLADPDADESDFLASVVQQLQQQNIPCRKVLCGKAYYWRTPENNLLTRSVMVADLTPEASLQLQQTGLGEAQALGFGLFLPHKDIQAVNTAAAS